MHLSNLKAMLKTVEEGMCKHKKIPFETRSCLRPCYQDTRIMTPDSTVETLMFFSPPSRDIVWLGCVLELNLQPLAGRN